MLSLQQKMLIMPHINRAWLSIRWISEASLPSQVELLQGEVAMPAPTGLTPSMVRQV